MQTFLPYPSFPQSARVLDRQRLGKQRVEVLQLLRAIHGHSKGWSNHPCTKMWANHDQALVRYGIAICEKWIERGYQDTCREKILSYSKPYAPYFKPPWLGNEDFHSSHRAVLLHKNPEWYSQFDWTEEPREKCIWPSNILSIDSPSPQR